MFFLFVFFFFVFFFFFFNDTATTEIYTLSLHDALPISDAAVVQPQERRGQPLEVAVAGGAQRGPVGGGVLVDDLRAQGCVHRHGNVALGGAQQDRGLGRGERVAPLEVRRQRLAHPASRQRALVDRRIHLASRLLRHAEGAVGEPGADVLA